VKLDGDRTYSMIVHTLGEYDAVKSTLQKEGANLWDNIGVDTMPVSPEKIEFTPKPPKPTELPTIKCSLNLDLIQKASTNLKNAAKRSSERNMTDHRTTGSNTPSRRKFFYWPIQVPFFLTFSIQSYYRLF